MEISNGKQLTIKIKKESIFGSKINKGDPEPEETSSFLSSKKPIS